MRKKVLVAGATGFIGKNIVERLAGRPDYELFGTYRNSASLERAQTGVEWIKADLTNAADVDRAIKGMDVVVQTAATTSGAKDIVTRPYIHVTDNAVMNSLIFRACHEANVGRVVFFSCTVMYASGQEPVREEGFDANAGMHKNYFGVGWTKVYIEKMCEFYSRLGRTKYTVIRHSNVYGPHDKFDLERSHVFGATMTKVMNAGKVGDLEVWGTGEEERDLLYVEDLADFVEIALDKQDAPFGLYNVGSGEAIAVNELVKRVIRHSGKDLTVRHDASLPTIKTRLCLDIQKAVAAFGWRPKTSLDDGIRKTMDWLTFLERPVTRRLAPKAR
ncbi:MAG: NAD-dependent epimerase/dehydratase family protein [Deltaproteobacteria bacterium]|nr:NAD-dependent epimerase/dehydratase family protein [Deltaproteobacteria bacterium]